MTSTDKFFGGFVSHQMDDESTRQSRKGNRQIQKQQWKKNQHFLVESVCERVCECDGRQYTQSVSQTGRPKTLDAE